MVFIEQWTIDKLVDFDLEKIDSDIGAPNKVNSGSRYGADKATLKKLPETPSACADSLDFFSLDDDNESFISPSKCNVKNLEGSLGEEEMKDGR